MSENGKLTRHKSTVEGTGYYHAGPRDQCKICTPQDDVKCEDREN